MIAVDRRNMHVYNLTYFWLEKSGEKKAVGKRNMHVYNLTYLRLKKRKKKR